MSRTAVSSAVIMILVNVGLAGSFADITGILTSDFRVVTISLASVNLFRATSVYTRVGSRSSSLGRFIHSTLSIAIAQAIRVTSAVAFAVGLSSFTASFAGFKGRVTIGLVIGKARFTVNITSVKGRMTPVLFSLLALWVNGRWRRRSNDSSPGYIKDEGGR